MRLDLFSMFFGKLHRLMFTETMIPSLNYSIKELKENFEIKHYIYTTLTDKKELEQKYKPSYPVIYDIEIIPRTPDYRGNLYLAFQEEIKRSINEDSVVLIAQSDTIWGQGIVKILKEMNQGEYFVACHARIDYEKGFEKMKEFLKKPHSNKELVNLCMNEIQHPLVEHGKSHDEPYWRCKKFDDYYEVKFKEPAPIAFRGSELLLHGWDHPDNEFLECLDHQCVDLMLKNNKLKWIESSEEFYWSEWTSNKIYLPTIYNNIWLDSCKFFNKLPVKFYFK